MVLFFFFGGADYSEVKLNMTFKVEEGQSPSLDEFNEFLTAVSKLHEQVIVNTQPEYFDSGHPSNRQILEWHKMNVTHICRKNPFDIVLKFQLLKEGIATYWPFLKALIAFCKRYGKNSNDLNETIELLRTFFNLLYDKNHDSSFSSKESSFLKPFDRKDTLLEKMNRRFTQCLSDRRFRVYYDKFCNTAITITDLVSKVESLKLSHDFLGNDVSIQQK